MDNPIRYQDFFDFSDDKTIKEAIKDIRSLSDAYNDFIKTVVGGQLSTLATQQKDIVASISELNEASKGLNITNKDSQKTLVENTTALTALTNALEENKKAKQSVKDTEVVLANSVDGLTQRLKAQLAEYNKLDPTIEGNLERMLSLAKATQQTRDAIQQLTSETKLSSNAFAVAKGSYAELDAETKALVKSLKQLEGGMTGNNATAKQLQAQIFANTEKLKQFDSAMNQNFRNVGNYKSAFNGLNNATSQIFRELPSAAVSLNTFFLAISNNLPILFDEIARVNKGIAEQKIAAAEAAKAIEILTKEQALAAGVTEELAVAQAALAREQALTNASVAASPSIWKALGQSIFSVSTLLTLAVVALTFFGGRIVGFFTGTTEASKKAEEANKKYAESIAQITRTSVVAAQKEVELLSVRLRVAQNTALSDSQRLAAVNEIQAKYPEYFASLSKEAILNGKVANATRDAAKAIFEKANQQAAWNKFQEAGGRVYDMQLAQTAAQEKLTAATANYNNLNNAANANPTNGYVRNAAIAALKAQQSAQSDLNVATANYNKALTEQNKHLVNAERSGNAIAAIEDAALGQGRTPARIQKDLDGISARLKVTAVDTEVYSNLMKEQRKLQDELADAQNKTNETDKEAAKALKDKEAAERKFQEVLRKRVELIKATAAASVTGAELDFQGTPKATQNQIDLATRKRDIDVKAANDIISITVKGSKLYVEAVKLKEEAEKDYGKTVHEINVKRIEEESEVLDALVNKRGAERKALEAVQAAERSLAIDQQANSINLRAARGQLTQPQAQQALFDLQVQQISDEIRLRRDALNKAIEGTEDYFNKRKALLEKERELVNANADFEIRKAEELKAKKQAIIEATANFVSSIAQASTDFVKGNYDDELDQLSKNKDFELSVAGDNAAAKKRIEEDFAKEQSRIRREQAEAARFEALFNIAIQTAQAVQKSIAASPTTFGLPFSAFALASGIIQEGLVAARPLPKYWKGRNKKSNWEWAEVNDQGWELIERDGQLRVEASGKRTATLLHPEDKVYTHEQSVKMITQEREALATAELFSGSLRLGLSAYTSEQERRENRIANAIATQGLTRDTLVSAFQQGLAELPMQLNTFDAAGWRTFTIKQNTRVEDLNNRQKLGGNG